jgi:flavin reductase (DIM6/NTAB) family NADH-FMN oxidoreductase RutF
MIPALQTSILILFPPLMHLLPRRLLVIRGRGPRTALINAPTRYLSSTKMGSKGPSAHPDFRTVEASRPKFDEATTFHYTKTVDPSWSYGDGANALHAAGADRPHVSIDPYGEGRPAPFNYKLLISAVVPRPIAFVSTRGADGTTNLAPFSYFNMVNHNPPLFVIGFSSPVARAKDTLRNLMETKECVVNIIGEHFVEAANSCSVDAPPEASEWVVSGLTPVYDCKNVKCARVKESVFSIEGKLDMYKEYSSPATGQASGTVVIIEGTNFWVREDALNEDKNMVDESVSTSQNVFFFGNVPACSDSDKGAPPH